jgi:competence ComEA-like helix-hairpin-helix protein
VKWFDWLKTHWDGCLFGAVMLATACQVFAWLWPAQPIITPVIAQKIRVEQQQPRYRMQSVTAVKQDDTAYSMYQLAEPPKTSSYHFESAPNTNPVTDTELKPININKASAAQLEALPGVGPKLAQRIISFRQKQRIASLADLDQVKGIGPHLMEKLDQYLLY